MSPAAKRKQSPRSKGRGLLSEDHSDIRLVPAKDRDWWVKLSEPAKVRFAERHGKRWTPEETRQLVLADPDTEDYYELGAEMGRAPGALRIRRSHMIHLLRDEYGHVQKAEAYLEDPKEHHRLADIGQVYVMLKELGFFDLPVSEQFKRARHLKQPTNAWRGDKSSQVLRQRRQAREALRQGLRSKPRRASSS